MPRKTPKLSAARTRIVSAAAIRLDHRKSVQTFKGIFCDDISEFESYMPKLANVLFTTELARRLDGTGVTANCFHPGLVATGFNRNNGLLMDLGMTILRPVSRSPEKGAETLVWLATSPDVANVSGGYFFDQEQRPPSPEGQDTETAARLWEISERQCVVSGRNSEARS